MAIQANNIKLSSKSLSLRGIASFFTPPYNKEKNRRKTSNPITKEGKLSWSSFHFRSASLTRLMDPTDHHQTKNATLSCFFFTKWLVTNTTIWRARYKLKCLVWENLVDYHLRSLSYTFKRLLACFYLAWVLRCYDHLLHLTILLATTPIFIIMNVIVLTTNNPYKHKYTQRASPSL